MIQQRVHAVQLFNQDVLRIQFIKQGLGIGHAQGKEIGFRREILNARIGVQRRAHQAEHGLAAQRRGVDVQVLADAHMNRKPKGNVLPRLLAAGVPVALESRYQAAHNKVLIVDAAGPDCVVLTGSYNFTWSAQNRNAENVLVLRGHCELAQAYRENWLRHRREAVAITSLPVKR